MASIYDLKPRFQALLRPAVRGLARLKVTPNQVTLAALLISIAAGGLIVVDPAEPKLLPVLPIVLFIRMALNAMDGMLAREHRMQSALGQLLNELGDVISDTALYLPLALVPGFNPALIVLILLLATFGEMTGIISQTLGASRRYDGPMGKSDRAFVFAAIGLALGLGTPAGTWLTSLLSLITLLSVLTVFNRARRALGEVNA